MLLALLLVAALLRLPDLNRQSRHGDEYMQTSCYSSSLWSVIQTARTHGQPPLDYVLGWAIAKVTDGTAAMRLPAAVFGTLSVAATFLLFAPIIGVHAATLAACLIALSPLHIRMSLTARPYTIFVLAWLLSLWTFARAIEHPSGKRVTALAVTAFFMIWTNGFGPLVGLAAMGLGVVIHLSVCAWNHRAGDLRRLLRTGAAIAGVGVVALLMVVFLVAGAREWTSLDSTQSNWGAAVAAVAERIAQNTRLTWSVWREFFGPWGVAVVLTALWGVVVVRRNWSQSTLPVRCVWTAAGLTAPILIVTFSVMVPTMSLRARYLLILLPLIAGLAGAGIDDLAAKMRRVAAQPAAAAVLAVCVLAAPAGSAWRQHALCDQQDWRGCGQFLADRVNASDVVLVLEDRSLGEYQPPFWGKYEWRHDAPKPLAEAAWTLATSRPHWERLQRQSGRCFLVLARSVEPQDAAAYLQAGLQQAPAGWTLHKFRGLDLLSPAAAQPNGAAGVAEACRVLAGWPWATPGVQAIPLLLRGRLLEAAGAHDEAREAFAAARACVPEAQRAWLTRVAGGLLDAQ
jgi:hypothetical protein